MAIDVATYLKQLEKKKGKLGRWEAEIFQLLYAKASYQDIAEYLKLNETNATKMEVYRFIHRKKRRHLLNINTTGNVTSENHSSAQGTNKGKTGDIPSKHQEDSGMPKFNWRQDRKKDKPKW